MRTIDGDLEPATQRTRDEFSVLTRVTEFRRKYLGVDHHIPQHPHGVLSRRLGHLGHLESDYAELELASLAVCRG